MANILSFNDLPDTKSGSGSKPLAALSFDDLPGPDTPPSGAPMSALAVPLAHAGEGAPAAGSTPAPSAPPSGLGQRANARFDAINRAPGTLAEGINAPFAENPVWATTSEEEKGLQVIPEFGGLRTAVRTLGATGKSIENLMSAAFNSAPQATTQALAEIAGASPSDARALGRDVALGVQVAPMQAGTPRGSIVPRESVAAADVASTPRPSPLGPEVLKPGDAESPIPTDLIQKGREVIRDAAQGKTAQVVDFSDLPVAKREAAPVASARPAEQLPAAPATSVEPMPTAAPIRPAEQPAPQQPQPAMAAEPLPAPIPRPEITPATEPLRTPTEPVTVRPAEPQPAQPIPPPPEPLPSGPVRYTAQDIASAHEDIAAATARTQTGPHLLNAIRELGGFRITDQTGKVTPQGAEIRDIFKDGYKNGLIGMGGKSPEAMMKTLAENGWLSDRDYRNVDPQEMYNLLDRAARGERIYHPEADTGQATYRAMINRELADAGVGAADLPEVKARKLAEYRASEKADTVAREFEDIIAKELEGLEPDDYRDIRNAYEPGSDIGAEREAPPSARSPLEEAGPVAQVEEGAGLRSAEAAGLGEVRQPPSVQELGQTVLPGAEAATPEALKAAADRRAIEEAQQLPRANSGKVQKPNDQGLFAPPEEKTLFQTAYHGSPHDFDKFEAGEKIGTGEGHQAYGHGLYFAGKKEVAEYYRDALSRNTPISQEALAEYFKPGRIVKGYSGLDKVIKFHPASEDPKYGRWSVEVIHVDKDGNPLRGERARNHSTMPSRDAVNEARKADGLEPERGRVYHVDLAPKENEWLDWDKPVSQQSDLVKQNLRPFYEGRLRRVPYSQTEDRIVLGPKGFSNLKATDKYPAGTEPIGTVKHGEEIPSLSQWAVDNDRNSGEWVYHNLVGQDSVGYFEPSFTSQRLQGAGIRGIRYLDGSSRNTGTLRILSPHESTSGKWTVGYAPNGPNVRFETEVEARAHFAAEKAKQSSNYVVFDPKDVTIEAKYRRGEGVASPTTGESVKLGDGLVGRMPENPTPAESALIDEVGKIAQKIVPTAKVRAARELRADMGGAEQAVGDTVYGATYRNGSKRLIAWSLETPDAPGTLRHEAVHYLKRSEFIRPDEWSVMSKAAERQDWIKKHNIEDRYSDLSREQKIEESVAEEYAAWARGQSKAAPLVQRVFARIKNLLGQVAGHVRKTFGKDATAEDVFRSIESGEVGRRSSAGEVYLGDGLYAQMPEYKPGDTRNGYDVVKSIEAAKKAIAEGRDIEAVIKRLGDHGIEVSRDLFGLTEPGNPANANRKPQSTLTSIKGTGEERARAINDDTYNVGIEAPQLEAADKLVTSDLDRAIQVAMRQKVPPSGVHPEFVYMAVERKAVADGDYELQRMLASSKIAEEATTMGQRSAAWRNRLENSPVADMRTIQDARQAKLKERGLKVKKETDTFVTDALSKIKKERVAQRKTAPKETFESILDTWACGY